MSVIKEANGNLEDTEWVFLGELLPHGCSCSKASCQVPGEPFDL